MQLEEVRIEEIKTDEDNPNQMTNDQLNSLKASIEAYGNLQPIVIDQHSNIIDGYHRYLAYKSLNKETIPAIRIEITNDSDKRIIRQTMNKLRGTHDPQKDAQEFLKILKANQEQKLFQISSIRETDFYKTLKAVAQPEQKDIIPEPPEEPITQSGDIWIMGDHRLICGDSRKEETYKDLMQEEKAHLVITDPPYGVDYVQNIVARERGNEKWTNIKNDNLKGEALEFFCYDFLMPMKKYTTEDSAYYIFFGSKTYHHLIRALERAGIYYALPLIWYKGRATISWAKYHPDYELSAYAGNGTKAKPPPLKTNKYHKRNNKLCRRRCQTKSSKMVCQIRPNNHLANQTRLKYIISTPNTETRRISGTGNTKLLKRKRNSLRYIRRCRLQPDSLPQTKKNLERCGIRAKVLRRDSKTLGTLLWPNSQIN